MLAPVRATFRAVATTVVPETAVLDDAGWTRLEAIVEEAVAERPARMRRQLALFVRVIDGLALLRHGRRFEALAPARRTRLLERLQDSRMLLLRRGLWGLRTLVFMGWYAQADTAARIGYRGHVRGWGARTDAAATAELASVPPGVPGIPTGPGGSD